MSMLAIRPDRLRWLVTPLLLMVLGAPAVAGSRLLATAGATSIEGSAGGGITPWAMLAGYGDRGEFGCAASLNRVDTADYAFKSMSFGCSVNNRLELAYASQALDLDGLIPLLGLPDGQQLRQHVFTAKYRVAGDLAYGRYGQLSVALVHKENRDGWLARTAGASETSDVEGYVTFGKLFIDGPFGQMWYLNATARLTRANQGGLLGFGGDRSDSRELKPELAIAMFPRRDLAVGIEYRGKPDKLSFAAEDDWADLFVAWFPNKHVSLVAAWADLGEIGTLKGQTGLYLALNGSF